MNNGDYIREMDDERLAEFLFTWGINSASDFLKHRGIYLMNERNLREWLKSDDFICVETYVDKKCV